MESESIAPRNHSTLMWIGGASLLIWPMSAVVYGIQDLSSSGMGGFVLVYVLFSLLLNATLWAPAAAVAMKHRSDSSSGRTFAIGACSSQILSVVLLLVLDMTRTTGRVPMLLVAIIFFGTPPLVANRLLNRGERS